MKKMKQIGLLITFLFFINITYAQSTRVINQSLELNNTVDNPTTIDSLITKSAGSNVLKTTKYTDLLSKVSTDIKLSERNLDIINNALNITTNQTDISNLTASQSGGLKSFTTLALLQAYATPNINDSYKVTNDGTSTNNGFYHWTTGTTYIKDAELVQNTIDRLNSSEAVSGEAVDTFVKDLYDINLVTSLDEVFSNVYGSVGTSQTEDSLILDSTGGTITTFLYIDNKDGYISSTDIAKLKLDIDVVGGTYLIGLYPRLDEVIIQSVSTSGSGNFTGTIDLETTTHPEVTDYRILLRAIGGAVVTVNNIYIGKGDNSANVKKYDEVYPKLPKEAIVKNYSPIYDLEDANFGEITKDPTNYNLGEIQGVTATNVGIQFDLEQLDLLASDKFHISAMLKQELSGSLYFLFRQYDSVGTQLESVTQGIYIDDIWKEFIYSRDILPTATKITIFLENRGQDNTKSIFFENFIISDKYVKQTYIVEDKIEKLTDLVNDKPINLYRNYKNNFTEVSRFSNDVTPIGITRVGNKNIVTNTTYVFPLMDVLPTDVGRTVYLKFPDMVYNENTGDATVRILQYDGTTYTGYNQLLYSGQDIFEFEYVITAGTESLQFGFYSTNDANLEFENVYASFEPYSEFQEPLPIYDINLMEKGVVTNYFPDIYLNSYINILGDKANKTTSVDTDGYPILTINGDNNIEQSIQWNFETDYLFNDNNKLFFNVLVKTTLGESFRVRVRYYDSIGNPITATEKVYITKVGEWDEVYILNETVIGESRREIEILYDEANGESITIKNPLLTNKFTTQAIGETIEPKDKVSNFLEFRDTMSDVIEDGVKGIVAVGNLLFKSNSDVILDETSYDLINYNIRPVNRKMQDVVYVDTQGYMLLLIDSEDIMWFTDGNTTLSKITKTDFKNALSIIVHTEERRLFDTTQLTSVIATPIAALREMGNGEVVGRTAGTSGLFYYSTNNKSTFTLSTADSLNGVLIDGWAFDVYDNIVVASGYSSSVIGYGIGRLIVSTDYGVTFNTIFDIATQSIFGATSTAQAHIHGCAYDKYWDRIYMMMGDYDVIEQGETTGKIFYTDNYTDATPTWNMSDYNIDKITQDGREQYCTIYPMKDSFLLGTDMNPSGIVRMNRISKDRWTKRETVYPISDELSHIPASFNQTDADMPVMIHLGKVSTLLANNADNTSYVVATFDGVNFFEIWRDTIVHESFQNNDARVYAFKDGEVYIRQRDTRFVGTRTLVLGKMFKWK